MDEPRTSPPLQRFFLEGRVGERRPRHFSLVDHLCLNADQAIRGIFGVSLTTGRPYPARHEAEPALSSDHQKQSADLMRVNHAGEVCAQALYHGQGLVSRDPQVREKLKLAAIEEGDHLSWCSKRLQELGNHTSYLSPLWYTGSFVIGFAAGIWGDRWSLGFLAETEQQVVNHLAGHLKTLPVQDQKSFKIVQQMQEDEARHRDDAMKLGAKELPLCIKKMMSLASKIMVKVASKL